MNNQTYSEVLADCVVTLAEALKGLFEAVRETWGEIVKFVELINDAFLNLDDKPSWNTPKKLVLNSQVFNKKPMMARARSCC